MHTLRQVLGEGMAPHLGTVAAALPAVWSRAAPGQAAPSAPGTETRLHSALIAVLTHLLRRLPAAAMARPPQPPRLAGSVAGACGLLLLHLQSTLLAIIMQPCDYTHAAMARGAELLQG